MTVYPACFYKEKNGQYSVLFPDFNYSGTCGDDFQDAKKMAVDFLACYVYELILSKSELPSPSDISDIDINSGYDEYESAFIDFVSVDVDDYVQKHFID